MRDLVRAAEGAVDKAKDLLFRYETIRDRGDYQAPILKMIEKQKTLVQQHERRLHLLKFPKLSRREEIEIILAALDDESLVKTYMEELKGVK